MSASPLSVWPLFTPRIRYIKIAPYTINCVDSVTINGCSLNFATLKPFTKPTSAPTPITSSSTSGSGAAFDISGNTLKTVVSSEAEIHAVRPTTRPAEISVPVSTIHPPIPSAIGSFAAVRDNIFTIEGIPKNEGRIIVMYTTASAIMMYMALLSSRSPIFFKLSFSATVHTSCLSKNFCDLSRIFCSQSHNLLLRRGLCIYLPGKLPAGHD